MTNEDAGRTTAPHPFSLCDESHVLPSDRHCVHCGQDETHPNHAGRITPSVPPSIAGLIARREAEVRAGTLAIAEA